MKMIIYIIFYNCTFLFFWTVSFKKYTVPTFFKIFLNYIYFIILKIFFYMKDIILYKKIKYFFLKCDLILETSTNQWLLWIAWMGLVRNSPNIMLNTLQHWYVS